MRLTVADDVELKTVFFEISGDGFSKSGSAKVDKSRRLKLRIGGIPEGTGYLVALRAEGDDPELECGGEAEFDVTRGKATKVQVSLSCRLPKPNGSVVVTGDFNTCPSVEALNVLPAETGIGGTIALEGEALDPDDAPGSLSYSWSTTSGDLSSTSSSSTELTCTEPGTAIVSLTVSDGDCEEVVDATVTCSGDEPGGGTAVLIWNEVESNGGAPDDWAELYNAGDATADLSGYVFKDNDDGHVYVIPDGTSIAPNAYLVLEGYDFGLGSSDTVRLFDPELSLLISYSWEGHAPTTYGRCPNVSGDFGITTTSTKGGPNDCTPLVVFNEVESSGGSPDDWAELYNMGSNVADLSGLVFKDNDDEHSYTLPEGTLLAPGEYLVLEAADFGFGLGGGDSVRLFATDGSLLDSYAWAAHASVTYGRCPNGGGDFLDTTAPTKGAANACDISIKINEIESSGGVPGDWIELLNAGNGATDISGWVFKDNDDSHEYVIPAGTVLQPGEISVLDEATFDFGLGGGDSARLFDSAGVLIDSYTYESHAATTYGRCPDGAGDFVTTASPTRGEPNDCPLDPNTASEWPGGNTTATVDPQDTFSSNLSGLHYTPQSASGPDVLWASLNGPSKIYRLVSNGTRWAPDAGEWADGKLLTYPGGSGEPDAEGITKAEWDQAGIYVSTERNNQNSGVSRLSILRFDETAAGTTLAASHEWNLTALLPTVGANAGLEAITWLPDSFLQASGWADPLTGADYDPSLYPNHGTGLFFVGIEDTGSLHLVALDHSTLIASVLLSIPSGHAKVMALEFDRDTGLLWAGCDDTCGNETTVLALMDGSFDVAARFARPAGLPNVNNEGLALAPETQCAGDSKAVFWSDDNDTDGFSLRLGSMACGGLSL